VHVEEGQLILRPPARSSHRFSPFRQKLRPQFPRCETRDGRKTCWLVEFSVGVVQLHWHRIRLASGPYSRSFWLFLGSDAPSCSATGRNPGLPLQGGLPGPVLHPLARVALPELLLAAHTGPSVHSVALLEQVTKNSHCHTECTEQAALLTEENGGIELHRWILEKYPAFRQRMRFGY
jgi:hypothetical protein